MTARVRQTLMEADWARLEAARPGAVAVLRSLGVDSADVAATPARTAYYFPGVAAGRHAEFDRDINADGPSGAVIVLDNPVAGGNTDT